MCFLILCFYNLVKLYLIHVLSTLLTLSTSLWWNKIIIAGGVISHRQWGGVDTTGCCRVKYLRSTTTELHAVCQDGHASAWLRPETAEVVSDGVVGVVLWRDHQLAAAETRWVVRHPRHRLARLHLNVSVPVQPVVCTVHQLPTSRPVSATLSSSSSSSSS